MLTYEVPISFYNPKVRQVVSFRKAKIELRPNII